ncbi:MAG: signal peptidase I [Hominisplanchenecus sp.]
MNEDTDRRRGKIAGEVEVKVKEIISWVVYFVCLLAAVFLINTFVVQRTMVSGESMYPYLHDKDQLMMDKLSYRFHDPERFDIVVFPVMRDGKEEYYIKRIIGLPGETVQILDGYIYINGEKLEENYGAEVMLDAGRAVQEITLAEDEYFVLGDNRNKSDDSRYENVGNLKRDKIVGRAWVRIWPLNRICIVKHQ